MLQTKYGQDLWRTMVFTRCEDKVYHLLDQDQDYITKDPVLMLHNGRQYLNATSMGNPQHIHSCLSSLNSI